MKTFKILTVLVVILFNINFATASDTFVCEPSVWDVETNSRIFDVEFTVKYNVDGGIGEKEKFVYGIVNDDPEEDLHMELEIPASPYQGYTYQILEVKAILYTTSYDEVYSTDSFSDYKTFIMPAFYVEYTTYDPALTDNDSDGITDLDEASIASMFSPVLVKTVTGNPDNTEKQAGLADVEAFINRSYLYKNGYFVFDDPNSGVTTGVTDAHRWWASYSSSSSRWFSYDTHAEISDEYELIGQVPAQNYAGAAVGQRPLYYHVYKDATYYYVQYWMWFNYNDISDQTMNSTWHEGDWEHITIRLTKNGSDYTPNAVNLYKHHGGHTKVNLTTIGKWSSTGNTPSNVKIGYDSTHRHPVIYVAANAHACYFYDGPIYQVIVTQGGTQKENYIDAVNYTTNLTIPSNNYLFKYDYLEKLGEVDEIANGYWHYFDWFTKHWRSRYTFSPWLAFHGRMGNYWSTAVYGIIPQSTKSPESPYFGVAGGGHEYYNFTINTSQDGFGNPDESHWFPLGSVFVHIYWIN